MVFLYAVLGGVAFIALFTGIMLYGLKRSIDAERKRIARALISFDVQKAKELIYQSGSLDKVNLLEAQAFLVEQGYETELYAKLDILALWLAKDVAVDNRKIRAEHVIEVSTVRLGFWPHPWAR